MDARRRTAVSIIRRAAAGKEPVSTVTKEDMRSQTRAERRRPEVVRWRREQLVQSGFSLPLAVQVAKDSGYDLHALIELVERGCSPELATRILAPLEAGDAA